MEHLWERIVNEYSPMLTLPPYFSGHVRTCVQYSYYK